MNIPTPEDLYNEEGFEIVNVIVDDGWRHGVDKTVVYNRPSDDTFWSVGFRVSTDGEWHGLREGDYSIFQVRPTKVTVTKYIKVK